MSAEEKSVEDWWNKMNLFQKQMVRLMVHMLGDTADGQVLVVRRKPDGLVVEIVDEPVTKDSVEG